MNAIPSDLNLDAIVGQKLIQVCLGEHDIQFHFEESISIQGDGNISVIQNGIEKRLNGDHGLLDSSPIAEVLGKKVTTWKKASSHCLSICLLGDIEILFTSEDSQYEDFIVKLIDTVW